MESMIKSEANSERKNEVELVITEVMDEVKNGNIAVAKKTAVPQLGSRKVAHSILVSFNLNSEDDDVLSLRIRDGRPRFVLEYKIPNGMDKNQVDYNKRELTIPFNFGEFGTLVQNASFVLEDKVKSFGVNCLYDIDKNGKKVDEKIKKAKLTIQKVEDTNAYEIVILNYFIQDENTLAFKETKFLLAPGKWHEFELNGKVIPNSFFSKSYAINFFNKLDKVLEALAKENRYSYETQFQTDRQSTPLALPSA